METDILLTLWSHGQHNLLSHAVYSPSLWFGQGVLTYASGPSSRRLVVRNPPLAKRGGLRRLSRDRETVTFREIRKATYSLKVT